MSMSGQQDIQDDQDFVPDSIVEDIEEGDLAGEDDVPPTQQTEAADIGGQLGFSPSNQALSLSQESLFDDCDMQGNDIVANDEEKQGTEESEQNNNEEQQEQEEESINEGTRPAAAVMVPQQAPRYKNQILSIIEDGSDDALNERNTVSDISGSYFPSQSNRQSHPVENNAVDTPSPLGGVEAPLDDDDNNLSSGHTPSSDPVPAVAIQDAVEARLISDESLASPHAIEEVGSKRGASRTIIIVAMVALVVIAITLALVCGGGGACRRTLPSVPTMAPTPAPTNFPTFGEGLARDRAEAIVADINSVTLSGLNMTYPPSGREPEELALAWLIDDNTFPVDYNAEQLRLRDRYALATFYYNILVNTSSWMIRDHCEWEHVTCEANRVVKFGVNKANELDGGTIPRDIGLLTTLTLLQLSENGLQGTIQSTLTQLVNLTKLALSRNALSGTIPSALSELVQLTQLSLNENSLFGEIPSSLGMLKELGYMEMNNNILTGNIPTEIGLLTQLSELFLDRNRLNGMLPSTMGALHKLQWFWMHDNRLTGEIPMGITNWTVFEDGFFHNNDFEGVMPFCVNNETIGRLVVDCMKVNCTCCSHCCPVAYNGIKQSGACAIG